MESASSSKGSRFEGQIPEKQHLCVEFPFYFKDPKKALETIGGESKLAEAVAGSSKFLELRFRPHDVYSHPAFGDRTESQGLLLRVRRKRKRATESRSVLVGAEIVGFVPISYKFNGMADYQYIAQPLEEQKVPLYEKDLSIVNRTTADFSEPNRILPPIFSRTDLPQPYAFQQSALGKSLGKKGKIKPAGEEEDHKHPNFVCQVDFRGRIPDTNTALSASAYTVGSIEEELFNLLKELFTQQPVWSRTKLDKRVPDRMRKLLKSVLPHIAYTFTTGPWRMLWLRFGFDPKTDPATRFSQMVDLRIRLPEKREEQDSSLSFSWEKRTMMSVGPLLTAENIAAAKKTWDDAPPPGRRKKRKLSGSPEKKTTGASIDETPPYMGQRFVPQRRKGADVDGARTTWHFTREDERAQERVQLYHIAVRNEEEEKQEREKLLRTERGSKTGGGQRVKPMTFGKLLRQRVVPQICDLYDDPEIRELLTTTQPLSCCTEKSGWFPKRLLSVVRLILRIKLEVLAAGNADSFRIQRDIGIAIRETHLLQGKLSRRKRSEKPRTSKSKKSSASQESSESDEEEDVEDMEEDDDEEDMVEGEEEVMEESEESEDEHLEAETYDTESLTGPQYV